MKGAKRACETFFFFLVNKKKRADPKSQPYKMHKIHSPLSDSPLEFWNKAFVKLNSPIGGVCGLSERWCIEFNIHNHNPSSHYLYLKPPDSSPCPCPCPWPPCPPPAANGWICFEFALSSISISLCIASGWLLPSLTSGPENSNE